MKIFEDLEARGLVKQITNTEKIRSLLNDNQITFYIGFDPTANSLHVGHLLQIVTARRLLEAGHKCIIVMGGATALIGDPSGKSSMRQMLSRSDIRCNIVDILLQMKNMLGSFEKLEIVNNLDWFDGVSFLEMLRDVGPLFSVNNMLRADCFKSRMEHGLSFLEFNYMILQAVDFLQLFKDQNCVLQIGGDDQWSNILAGIDLVHKKEGREAFGLTLPLLVNSDGTKMGKTEKGTVWLDPEKTSPFEFFQFWRNIPDSKVKECHNFFTDWFVFSAEFEITDINETKKQLAFHITKLVHGDSIARQVLGQVEALFEKQDTSMIETIPIQDNMHVLELITQCGFAKSRTDARNLINNKGITINDQVIDNPTIMITKEQFGNEITLRKGKKNFKRFLIKE